MPAQYQITTDVRRNLLRFELSGFFDHAVINRFLVDRAAAFAKLRCGPNQHLTLCDVSGCMIQSQEVFAGFRALFTQQETRSRRMAFVVGSSLARLQIRRLVEGRSDIGWFDTEAPAEAWLFAD
jgi:hypothetical protein